MVFKTTGLVKSLQLLIIKSKIEEDLVIIFNIYLLKERLESKITYI